jgi:hypothetical protein
MARSAVTEPRAVVFVSDRDGQALRRRERCLADAGIAHDLESERRASATYYKLCVSEGDAVNAYLALGAAGCGRPGRLREHPEPGVTEALSDVAGMLRSEAAVAATKLLDAVRVAAPQLLETLRSVRDG